MTAAGLARRLAAATVALSVAAVAGCGEERVVSCPAPIDARAWFGDIEREAGAWLTIDPSRPDEPAGFELPVVVSSNSCDGPDDAIEAKSAAIYGYYDHAAFLAQLDADFSTGQGAIGERVCREDHRQNTSLVVVAPTNGDLAPLLCPDTHAVWLVVVLRRAGCDPKSAEIVVEDDLSVSCLEPAP